MITSTQASQYLDQALGVSVPLDFLNAVIADVTTLEAAMASYSAATQYRIQCMAVAILASAGDPRRISSQTAASGAGRSFKNSDKALTALRRSLAALDTLGVTSAIIGPDPATNTMLMVVC